MNLSPERLAEIRADQERVNVEQARKSGEEHRDWATLGGSSTGRSNALMRSNCGLWTLWFRSSFGPSTRLSPRPRK